MKTKWIYETGAWLLLLLWAYAASSKLLDLEHFIATLGRSPILQGAPTFVAGVVITIELLLSVLLLLPATKYKAIWGSLVLLIVFTCYIIYMLLFAGKLPCSCGGIIQKLSWKQHLIFNGLYIFIATASIYGHRKNIAQSGQAEHLFTK